MKKQNNKSANSGFLMFIMAIFAAITYVILQDTLTRIILLFVNGDPKLFFENNSFLIDTLECFIMAIIYYIWYKGLRNIKIPCPSPEMTGNKPGLLEKKPFVRNLPILIVIALGLGGLSCLWLDFCSIFLQDTSIIGSSMESFEDTWSNTDQQPYLWVLLSVAIIGPIVEELLFRGVIYNYLEKISNGFMPAIVSGIIFGAWHMEPVQSVYAGIMGILIGLVYMKTKDLRFTITIHIVNNLLSTLPPGLDTDNISIGIDIVSIAMTIPVIIIMIFIIKSIKKDRALADNMAGNYPVQ